MIVEPGFRDWRGVWREANPDTVRAVRDTLGVDDDPPEYEVASASPTGVSRCVAPTGRRDGIAVQVYSLWSDDSGGIGDLADVATLAAASGADVLLLSPLHASVPGVPQEPSPYFPSSRQYRNPLHLRVPAITAGHDPASVIDRDDAWRAKLAALTAQWDRFAGEAAFDAYVDREGDDLARYATFCALTDFFGRPWVRWPAELRHPAHAAVRGFAAQRSDRVRFHQWLQWQLDDQLRTAAAAGAGLIHDVAVGFEPEGADAWIWQDLVAPGMHVGAPPDEFNRDGQDWGVPPLVPTRLRAADYAPVRAALGAAARHGVGFRIDHVMGLFRLFWIPVGGSPADGVYVRYPADELLDVVAGVSQRSGAFVVGEDLGTVEPGVREALATRRVLAYKVLWFEDDEPANWPPLSVGSVTTHDLATIAGAWTGVDGDPSLRERLARAIGGEYDASTEDVVQRAHTTLREAPCAVVVLTAEDLLRVPERPNRPGTTDGWNWSRRLPRSVGDLAAAYRGSRQRSSAAASARRSMTQGR